MDDDQDPHITTGVPDSELNTVESTFTNKAIVSTGPCGPPPNHYFIRNSRGFPQLIPSVGNPGDKRKKVLVTMEEKLRALQRLDAGEPAKIIAEELGVGKSTISDWKKHRTEIEKWYANQAGASCIKARKTMRKGKHAQVEKGLYHWFEYVRSRGFQVSGPLLQQKALQFKDKMEGEEGERFSASEGWLDRWKKRFGIGHLLNTVNKSEDESSVEDLKKELLELTDMEGEQLYCCGRTVLNYRMMPTKIFGSKETDCNINEETVMVLACSNATGNHKLRPAFIGKSEKFEAFESIKNDELLPFWYNQQKDVWLDGEVLKKWFENEFVPAVEKNLTINQLPRKAVLLVTNYPSFVDMNEVKNGNIRMVFLSVQDASLCQPMDRGILESLKKKYWCRLLSSVISTSTDCENCLKTFRNIDLVEVIQCMSEAWEEIPPLTYIQSWKHLINQKEDEEWPESENQINNDMANDDKELVSLLKKIIASDDVSLQDVNEWLANEEEDEIITDDIVAMVLKEPQQPDLDPSDENSTNYEANVMESVEIKAEPPVLDGDTCVENISPQINRIHHAEGFKAIIKTLEYVSQQEETSPEDIAWLIKWKDIAAKKSLQDEKQKKSVKRPKLHQH